MLQKIIEEILLINGVRETSTYNIERIIAMYNEGYTLFDMDAYANLNNIANDDYDIMLKDGIEYLYYSEFTQVKYSEFIRIDHNIVRSTIISYLLE